MKCLCCLSEEFQLQNFNSVDKKTYSQLTNLNLNDVTADQRKICENCSKALKQLQSFVSQCRKSFNAIKNSSQKLETHRRSQRKSADKVKVDVVEVSQDNDNNNPLSPAVMLFVDDETTSIATEILPDTSKQPDDLPFVNNLGTGESFITKLRQCSSKIWQCDTCGKDFASKFRLVTHIRKLQQVLHSTCSFKLIFINL